MQQIPSFLKLDGNKLRFNGDGELVYYIPEMYFKSKFAIVQGEYVKLMGIFYYAVFDKNGKSNGLKKFNFPTMFLTKPDYVEKVKNIKLNKDTEPDDYRLLKFKNNGEAVVSIKIPKSIFNVEEFYRMFMYGKLNNISYDEIQNYFFENIALNGSKYNLNAQLFGIIISEHCRDENDRSTLFRHTDMKNLTKYNMIPTKEIPKYVSPYVSVTSENFNDSMVHAILNDKPIPSPLEDIAISK